MKDEIKEMNLSEMLFNRDERLLDYITNLQTIEQQYSAILSENAELENKITNLQEKVNQYENPDDMALMFMWCNEKAKDKIKQLQEENKHLDEVNCQLRKKINNDIYKSRNEKAIEYINHEIFKRTILVGVGTKKYTRNILDNVLNILQGEDND